MKLDKEIIVDSAMKILNGKGIDALSMRALAAQLDVKAASLYFHFKNKEKLLEQISDTISGRVLNQLKDLDEVTLILLATALREQLKQVRDASRVFGETQPFTPNRMALIQLSLKLLKQQKIPDKYVTTVGNLLNNYILSFVADEQLFAQLPSDSLPNDMPLPIDDANPDDSFMYGLQLILKGIAANSTI